MTIEIKSRRTMQVLMTLEGDSLEGADLGYVRLEDADLHGANLEGADLYGANLSYADLHGADLHGADLRGAVLHSANLRGADLGGVSLYDADLGAADLRGANLHGAGLRYADLEGVRMNWCSHDLIAELLRRATARNPEHANDLARLMLAGLPLVTRERDWKWFAEAAIPTELRRWAVAVLASYVRADDNVPAILKSAIKEA